MKTLKLKELKEGKVYKCLLSGKNVLAYDDKGYVKTDHYYFTGLIWDESELNYKQIELEDDVLVELEENKSYTIKALYPGDTAKLMCNSCDHIFDANAGPALQCFNLKCPNCRQMLKSK